MNGSGSSVLVGQFVPIDIVAGKPTDFWRGLIGSVTVQESEKGRSLLSALLSFTDPHPDRPKESTPIEYRGAVILGETLRLCANGNDGFEYMVEIRAERCNANRPRK
jgi:hypothetical protein